MSATFRRLLIAFLGLTTVFIPASFASEPFEPRILITEVQTESETALEDFIELTNVSGEPRPQRLP